MALFVDLVALSNGLHGSVQMDLVALFSWIGWLRHRGILILDIKKDRLIYCIEFIGRTQDDQIVEYTKSFMDTNKIRFEYTLSKD